LRQQYGRRNVAYELAGKYAEQQRIFIQQGRKEFSDKIDSAHISGKNKEENKGKQKGIIHHF
jgi:ribosome recycling factor